MIARILLVLSLALTLTAFQVIEVDEGWDHQILYSKAGQLCKHTNDVCIVHDLRSGKISVSGNETMNYRCVIVELKRLLREETRTEKYLTDDLVNDAIFKCSRSIVGVTDPQDWSTSIALGVICIGFVIVISRIFNTIERTSGEIMEEFLRERNEEHTSISYDSD